MGRVTRASVTLNRMRNLLSIKTSGLCLICLKECENEDLTEECSIKFYRNLSRYLEIRFNNGQERDRDVEFSICGDCSALGTAFCQLFQEYEVIKMKLNSCTKTLKSIMKCAERIPSRVAAFNKRTKEDKPIAEDMRKEIIQKCVLKTTSTIPRVMVTRLGDNICNAIVPYVGPPLSSRLEAGQMMMSYLGCLISFWIVFSLSLLDADELKSFFKSNKTNRNKMLARLSSSISTQTAIEEYSSINNQGPIFGVTPKKKPRVAIEPLPNPNIGKRRQCQSLPLQSQSPNKQETDTDFGKRDQTQSKIQEIASKMMENYQDSRYGSTATPPETKRKSPKKSVCPVITPEKAMVAVKALEMTSSARKKASNAKVTPPQDDEVQLISTMTSTTFVPVVPTGTYPTYVYDIVKQEPTSAVSNIYNCHLCPLLQFPSRAQVEKHRVKVHKMTHYVQCPTCLAMFLSYHHLELHRNDNPFQCGIDEYAKQLEIVDVARPLFPYTERIVGDKFCPFENCYEVFENYIDLNLHLEAHGSFQCAFCPINFCKAHELALHEANYHTSAEKGFYARIGYDSRVPLSSQVKCSRCDYVCDYGHELATHFLKRHLKIQASENNKEMLLFRCNECDAQFVKKMQLKKHFNSAHATPTSPTQIETSPVLRSKRNKILCLFCKQVFTTKPLFQEHMLVAHGLKR